MIGFQDTENQRVIYKAGHRIVITRRMNRKTSEITVRVRIFEVGHSETPKVNEARTYDFHAGDAEYHKQIRHYE